MQNKVTLAVLSAAVVGVGGIVANAIRNIADAVASTSAQREIANVVADAVEAKFQTYVDALKEAGSFDAEAQQKALKEAVEACIETLSAGAKKYIEKASGGDIEGYLITKIEAEVHRQKSGVMTIAN